jgi:hypothetical protein
MSFLTKINITQMMILCNSKIYRLTKPQVKEIISFQNGMEYNKHWLIIKSLNPYFRLGTGKHREEIVYIDKDIKIYNNYDNYLKKLRESDLTTKHYKYRNL